MTKLISIILLIVSRVKIVLKKNNEDNIAALSGLSALFLILSIVPLIMFIISIAYIVAGSKFNMTTPTQIQSSSELIAYFIGEIIKAGKNASGAAIYTAIMALWSAGKGIFTVTDGIRRIYKIPEKRNWLMRRIISMGYIIVMLLIFVLGFLLMIFSSYIGMNLERNLFNHSPGFATVYFFRYIIVFLAMSFLLTLYIKLYLRRRVSDKRYSRIRAIYPGVAVDILCWMVITKGVEIYNSEFATTSVYGSLGAVMIWVMWVYFSMYLLLFGVQLNYLCRDIFADMRLFKLTLPGKIKEKRNNKKMG